MRNLSVFDEFHFEWTPGLGFCPPAESVLSATIRRSPTGEYALEMTVSSESRPTNGGCAADTEIETIDGCAQIMELPSRVLTQDEIDTMLDLFRRVVVWRTVFLEPCFLRVVDPCVTTSFIWDDFETTDFPCNPTHLTAQEASSILFFLDTLRSD